MALTDIKVPDIGDFAEVTVIELLVKPGDSVKVDQSLITVESDKASMEIPCSHAGVVKELKIKLGDKVSAGALLLGLEASSSADGPDTPDFKQNQAPALAAPAQVAINNESKTMPVAASTPLPALSAPPTKTATCWCWGPAPAAIRPPFARLTLASR